MGCHHRIAYIFLCVLHVLLLAALAYTLIGCESIYLKCNKCGPDGFIQKFEGCGFEINKEGENTVSPGKIIFIVGVVLSIVALILILVNVCKCDALKKWKKSVKKKFRWIFFVLLLVAGTIIASSALSDQFNRIKSGGGGATAGGGATGGGGATAGGGATEGGGATGGKGARLQDVLPIITAILAPAEVLLVLCMLCCKPAKEKEDDDDDDDDDDNGRGKSGSKRGGNDSRGGLFGNGSNTFHVFVNFSAQRSGEVKKDNQFRMLHATTPSNVYGSSD